MVTRLLGITVEQLADIYVDFTASAEISVSMNYGLNDSVDYGFKVFRLETERHEVVECVVCVSCGSGVSMSTAEK
jgi:hypothetical protein